MSKLKSNARLSTTHGVGPLPSTADLQVGLIHAGKAVFVNQIYSHWYDMTNSLLLETRQSLRHTRMRVGRWASGSRPEHQSWDSSSKYTSLSGTKIGLCDIFASNLCLGAVRNLLLVPVPLTVYAGGSEERRGPRRVTPSPSPPHISTPISAKQSVRPMCGLRVFPWTRRDPNN